MITTERGFKKLEGGDYIPNAFYAEGSAFNGNVELLEKELGARKSNENMLLNWDFTNPVNQRDISVFAAGSYGLDMWLLATGGSCGVNAGGIVLTGTLIQRLEWQADKWPFNGAEVTLSAKLADGSIKSVTLVPDAHADVYAEVDGITMGMYNGATWKEFRISAAGAEIRAVKLEKGVRTSLGEERIMYYDTELLRCQRYFVRYNGVPSSTTQMGYAMGVSATNAGAVIALPNNMRLSIPTVTYMGAPVLRKGVTDSAVTDIKINVLHRNMLYFAIFSTGLTIGDIYAVRLPSGAGIDISAEL